MMEADMEFCSRRSWMKKSIALTAAGSTFTSSILLPSTAFAARQGKFNWFEWRP